MSDLNQSEEPEGTVPPSGGPDLRRPHAPRGTVEQLRETLNQLLPLLEPDVEPALVLELRELESR